MMESIVYLCILLMYTNIDAHRDPTQKCTYIKERDGVKVNCSSQEHKAVPDYLCKNNQTLKTVSNRTITFTPKQITELDLSNNSIKNFSHNPFYCLVNLKVLNLERNKVKLSNEIYYKGLFSPLVSLRDLNIKHNSKDGVINDTVFGELIELKVLRMDTPNGTVFGEHFSQLKKLYNLDLSGVNGYCYIRRIENSTFQYFPYLKKLDLSACMIKNIDAGAFGFLEKLSELFLSYNLELGFAALQNITYNLRYTKIEKLHLENIRCFRGPDTELYEGHLKYLSNTPLKELNLAGNRLQWIGKNVLRNLPKTLQTLSLANNRLSIGVYAFDYRLLKELKEMNVSNQLNLPNVTAKLFQKCDENPDILPCNCTPGAQNLQKLSSTLPYEMDEGGDSYLECEERNINFGPAIITFYLPPKLQVLYWSSSRLFGTLGQFGINATLLRKIFMQNNILYSWIGPIHGSDSIEELDLSQNFCYNISAEFLSHFSGLKVLKLRENNIAKSLSSDSQGLMFRNQKNLEFLDLSYNDIEYLPGKIFKNAINIKQLLLQGNRLYKWGVKINHMRYLIFLDISGNRLETFTPVDIEHLNQHFQSENLTVDLSNNRLSCTCENINFLLWIVRFYSHFQDFNEYFCLDESIHVENLQKSLFILNKKCKSYLIWYVISCIGCTLMVTITACYLIYKNRWKIRYIRYVAGKKVRGYHRLQSSSSIGDFEYDAYISYSAKDVSFVKEDMIPNLEDKSSGQIKLAVMHRDMEPSGDHANNIMDYISRSKRTICVVTRKFLESDWQDYELNMARMEGVQTRKTLNFVHLILMPDVCKSKYPQKASDFIKKGYYLEYPEEAFGQQVFWETLRQEILKEIDISN